ncbi:MAG: hypothetical protein WC707_06390 [Candidatus Babeliaceae bacterium]|jgi:hypothetical protein
MIRHNKKRILIIALTIATAWTFDSRANVIQDHPYLTAIGCITGLTILGCYRAKKNAQAGSDITDLIKDPEIYCTDETETLAASLNISKLIDHTIVKKYVPSESISTIASNICKNYNSNMTSETRTPENLRNAFQPLRDKSTVERKMLAWTRNYFTKFSSKK